MDVSWFRLKYLDKLEDSKSKVGRRVLRFNVRIHLYPGILKLNVEFFNFKFWNYNLQL